MSVTIDGTVYDVPVLSVARSADFLDKYAERTEDGILHRELIGVYFNYKLEFGAITNAVTYAALWAKLTEPVEFHTVTVPDDILSDYSFTFTAYFSNVKDKLRKVKTSATYFQNLTVNFIAQEPARTPV